jgi:hypothetical protein
MIREGAPWSERETPAFVGWSSWSLDIVIIKSVGLTGGASRLGGGKSEQVRRLGAGASIIISATLIIILGRLVIISVTIVATSVVGGGVGCGICSPELSPCCFVSCATLVATATKSKLPDCIFSLGQTVLVILG